MFKRPSRCFYPIGLAVFAMVTMLGLPLSTASTAAASTCTLGDGSISLTVLEPTPNQVVTTPTLPLEVVANGYGWTPATRARRTCST